MGKDERLTPESSAEFLDQYYTRVFGEMWEKEREQLTHGLPVTFRVNRSQEGWREVEDFLRGQSAQVRRLHWCDAWQLTLGNTLDIKTCTRDSPLFEWRRWLARQGKCGAIERQEAVSMLPVLALGIKPEHFVLDMCASPGSKTSQALDIMCSQGKEKPKGFIVANELDQKRARILVARLRGLGPSCAQLVAVVNHNAKTLPNARSKSPDRIICDVPCSGDGTLRKNKGLLSHWQPHYGLGLHSTQVQIAMRGISLLKVGGLMAYSTCSLNPVENEAVVAAVMGKCRSAVQLVDWRPCGLETLPGFTCWDVVDDTGTVFKTFKQAVTRSKPKSCRNRFRESQWPPVDSTTANALQNCVRVVPSKGDTGGFFIAVFKKVQELPKRLEKTKKASAKRLREAGNTDVPRLKRYKASKRLEGWIESNPEVRIVSVGSALGDAKSE